MRTVHTPSRLQSASPITAMHKPLRWLQAGGAALALGIAMPSHAFNFGPDGMFSLRGFGEVSLSRANNQCPSEGCQEIPEGDRQRIWADAVVPGRPLSTVGSDFNQTQIWLDGKYDLGGGYQVKAAYSQNWRMGRADTPGFVREKNLALSHEEYGTATVGHMLSRTWQFSDYPFGANIGLAYPFAGSGAGYRNLTNALRYTSRTFEVAEGDMVMEVTYDRGNTAFKKNKPSFVELWAHYGKGNLSLDAMYQHTRNGTPSSFGANVFSGPFYDTAADGRLGNSSQSVATLIAIYQYSPKIELSGAVRHNRWSGANAVVAVPGGPPLVWNFPFNVDWNGSLNGVANPGYPANSTDLALGARYRIDKWTFSTGLAYYGKASTRNPSERGQSNSALVNTLGASYAFGNGWEASASVGMIHYRKKGLAPLSMPSNAMISGIDSRVTKSGNWISASVKYAF